MNKKGSTVIILIIVIVIFIIAGVVWYFEANKGAVSQISVTPNTITTVPTQSTTTVSSTTLSSTSWLASIKQTSPEVVGIPSSSSIPQEVQGKIAFMQNGEVWIANGDGGEQLQLTHTSGTVSTNAGDGGLFSFSPDFHYLAYYFFLRA